MMTGKLNYRLIGLALALVSLAGCMTGARRTAQATLDLSNRYESSLKQRVEADTALHNKLVDHIIIIKTRREPLNAEAEEQRAAYELANAAAYSRNGVLRWDGLRSYLSDGGTAELARLQESERLARSGRTALLAQLESVELDFAQLQLAQEKLESLAKRDSALDLVKFYVGVLKEVREEVEEQRANEEKSL